MKKIALLILLLSNITFAQSLAFNIVKGNDGQMDLKAISPMDTTSIEFTDRGIRKRIKIYTDSKKDFDLPTTLSLENILKKAGVDSSERKRALILIEKENKQDTILVVSTDGNKIKILAKDPTDSFQRSREARPDTSVNGEHEKNDHWSNDKGYDDNVEKNDNDDEDDDTITIKKKGSGRYFQKSDFGIYLGLNNWANANAAAPNMLYGLDTWGSRYFALSWRRNATLINGKQMDLAIAYGPEIAWNNFMFENSNMIVKDKTSNQVRFIDSGKSLEKSKLVVPTINFPMMLQFGFEEAKFHLGFGGYVGYRLNPHSKIKENGNKDKVRDNFGTNDFRYGITAELGRKNGLKFFGRYDMSPMFKDSQTYAKGLQAWSVGIRL